MYKFGADLTLEFVQSLGHAFLINAMMWAFDQNRSDLKVEISKDKRNIEQEKKHTRVLSRENHFQT